MLPTPAEDAVHKHLRYNVIANLLDGSYFGLAMGFGSFGTVVTLFVSQLTISPILIGLIPSIHAVGWQFPQLFTAGWVMRQRRYKPMVLWLTTQERIPFLGLALIAWFLPALGAPAALALCFLMLIWQGMGAGVTANAWQTMIAKIIPPESRGSFFGMQSALANVMMSIGAVLAGYLLERGIFPGNFALCFLLTAFAMVFSFVALALTREARDERQRTPQIKHEFWRTALRILRQDHSFDWFLTTRVFSLFASMSFAFYVIYGLRRFDMTMLTAGFMTATLTIAATLGNAVMGWAGDRLGHRSMLIFGALALTASAVTAWLAPSLHWLYLAFALEGLANASIWTIGMAMTVGYGTEAERPIYIGMSNTLTAPATILSPVFGGWLAELAGFQATFLTAAIFGVLTLLILVLFVRDPLKAESI